MTFDTQENVPKEFLPREFLPMTFNTQENVLKEFFPITFDTKEGAGGPYISETLTSWWLRWHQLGAKGVPAEG